jgi:hypothetical protein
MSDSGGIRIVNFTAESQRAQRKVKEDKLTDKH